MSRSRIEDWEYVMYAIREYPKLKAELEELHSQGLTANYSGMPHASGVSRVTEDAATRKLPPEEQKMYDAVSLAIEETKLENNHPFMKLKLIRLTEWQSSQKKMSVKEAAQALCISNQTAKRWHRGFGIAVGKHLGVIKDAKMPKYFK